MKMKFLEDLLKLLNGVVDGVGDECGWMRKCRRWKNVGISSLSKKVMIRQARANYALADFTCLMCWN